MRKALLIAAAMSGALLSFAAPAVADTNISIAGGILYWRSEDAGISNQLTVDTASGNKVHFVDEADPYGMRAQTSQCTPGRLNNAGNAVEVTCDRTGLGSVTLELGPGEDRVKYALGDLPVNAAGADGADTLTSAGAADSLSGQQGNDTLESGAGDDRVNGGDGDDTINAGEGNDRVDGGAGSDVVDAGAGDDDIISADGEPDTIDCGPGADKINADPIDRLLNCETEQRSDVAPPPSSGGAARVEDDVRPVLEIGGTTLQKISAKKRRIAIAVTTSERAIVNASGFLDARGINTRMKPTASNITVAGGGAYAYLTLSKKQVRDALVDLRHRHRPKILVTVSAVDAAGNTSPPQRLTIRLRR
jgi:Ca2+-binding RTX toxin-like protein